jgi:hypothetical protein
MSSDEQQSQNGSEAQESDTESDATPDTSWLEFEPIRGGTLPGGEHRGSKGGGEER